MAYKCTSKSYNLSGHTATKNKMSKLLAPTALLSVILITLYLTLPATVQGGMMKKGGMMGGGGGNGVLELLAAGIVAKLLQDMKGSLGMMSMKSQTKYVPVPIYVASGGGMMMDSGWKGGMMMNSGWKGGMMMNSGWKGGMMGGD